MTTLDAVLAKNTAFVDMHDLIATMRRSPNYNPSIRADHDLDLLFVVAALEEYGLDKRCYVYFPRLDGAGVVTCWGLPANRLMDLSFKAPETLTKHEVMEMANLDAALRVMAPRPSLPDMDGKPIYEGSKVWFSSSSSSERHYKIGDYRTGARRGKVTKLAKSRVTIEFTYKNGRTAFVSLKSTQVFKA